MVHLFCSTANLTLGMDSGLGNNRCSLNLGAEAGTEPSPTKPALHSSGLWEAPSILPDPTSRPSTYQVMFWKDLGFFALNSYILTSLSREWRNEQFLCI